VIGSPVTERPQRVNVSELRWKSEDYYLTTEGYPLGTTCWYVRASVDGYGSRTVCGSTPAAVYRKVAEFLSNPRGYRNKRGSSELPIEGEE